MEPVWVWARVLWLCSLVFLWDSQPWLWGEGGVSDCFACSLDPYLSFSWDTTFNHDVRICGQSYYVLFVDLGRGEVGEGTGRERKLCSGCNVWEKNVKKNSRDTFKKEERKKFYSYNSKRQHTSLRTARLHSYPYVFILTMCFIFFWSKCSVVLFSEVNPSNWYGNFSDMGCSKIAKESILQRSLSWSRSKQFKSSRKPLKLSRYAKVLTLQAAIRSENF